MFHGLLDKLTENKKVFNLIKKFFWVFVTPCLIWLIGTNIMNLKAKWTFLMGLFNTNVLAYGKYSEEYMIMFITQNKSDHNYWFKKYIIEKFE